MQQRAMSDVGAGGFVMAFAVLWLALTTMHLWLPLGLPDAPKPAVDPPVVGLMLIGLMLAALALLIMSSPLWERERAHRTFYALTNRRALIVVEGAQGVVQSVPPAEFEIERTTIECSDHDTDWSDLILKRETTGSGGSEITTTIGFFGITDAATVEQLARQIAGGALI